MTDRSNREINGEIRDVLQPESAEITQDVISPVMTKLTEIDPVEMFDPPDIVNKLSTNYYIFAQ